MTLEDAKLLQVIMIFFSRRNTIRGNIMTFITYRAFTRHKHQSPIVFSDHSQQEYQAGEMINISDGGMVFLAEHELKPGDRVDIKILEDTPDSARLEPNRDYSAEVRWCEKSDGKETSNYRVGIRFLLEKCRMCGKEIQLNAMDEKPLCKDCGDRINSLPDGTAKESIKEQIKGNVL
jgi:hypothetical protein